ncbi:uncharacterized protein LTR77_008720 [Saxophila tyrrhenica]|uniref:tripeptidyl-peptidase II n=1 Tax=Saxophila tyrrhenica TaxID=1690608 RepID=A0AAV9P033_9PEZI|nr:hypothetical protein LTR77_008720 [Saxophila tyrrhenica]
MLSTAAFLALVLPAYGAVHESLAALPAGWTESSTSLAGSSELQMQVALQYQNLDQLESKLKSVSTPGSSSYGQYLDLDDLNSVFAATSESESKVKSWLSQSGASNIASDGSMVSFTTSVDNANKMLDTKFKLYSNGQTHKVGTMAYSVPDELSDHIDLVSPTTYFGSMKAHRAVPDITPSRTEQSPADRKRQVSPSCETTITIGSGNVTRDFTVLGPDCFKQLYNVGNYQAHPNSGSTVAFGSFLNQSASFSDLAKFEKIYNIESQSFTVTLINGGVNDQDPLTESDGEANLDVQNIIGLAHGLPVTEYITGGSPPFRGDLLSKISEPHNQNEPYLDYYNYLLSQPNSALPYVISNSYGDHEDTVPERYATRVCNQIGMMGLRGRTILESSGDEGVGAVCRSNSGSKAPQFTPQFPGTCPYVTAVGGTQFLDPEEAWNASSGGFSFYFDRPWYQNAAVQTYLNQEISAETKKYYRSNGYVDFNGRGFPDISAHSLYPDYLTVINGTAQPNGGTSAAAPIVAAIFALLNDARFRAGKPAMGFINPWLYNSAAGKALTDITTGAALGCAGTDLQNGLKIPGAGIIPFATWNATVGWDPVTGLGTPDFQALKALALGM